MKKIGVITFSKSINYGAFLQAYALQATLKKMNYKASLMNYENPVDKKRYATIKASSLKELIASLVFLPINLVRKNNFKKCIKKLDFTDMQKGYDVAITGSDQVWNPKLTGNKIEEKFFLSDITAKKKLSYAASVANEEVIKEYKDIFKDRLNRLDAISVRESSAQKLIEKIVNKKVKLVADPTLLLTRNEWLNKTNTVARNKKQYIFTYFVGGINSNESKVLAQVCQNLNLKCVTYSKIPREKAIYKYAYTDGPIRFLARMRDAQLVITSSFHGIALSIILHKNFYYFMPRADRRSRVDSLLKYVGLTNRIIETEADINKINLEDIDYTEPQKKLDKLRQESLDWLKNAIEN